MRDLSLDFAKGVMITLMVLFHYDPYGLVQSFTSVTDGLTVSFFLPAFFFLSGYLTKPEEPLVGLKKIADRIARPYLVFSLLYMALIFLGQRGFYPVRQQLDLETPWSWGRILVTGSITPFYYLYILVVFRVGVLLAWRISAQPAHRWIALLSILLGLQNLPVNLVGWPYLCLGLAWSALGMPLCWGRYAAVPIVLELTALGYQILARGVRIFPGSGELAVQAIWSVAWLSATISAHHRSSLAVRRTMEMVGRYSLSVLVMHVFVLKVALLIQRGLRTVDSTGLVDVVAATALGVGVPILATHLCDRWGIAGWFLGHGALTASQSGPETGVPGQSASARGAA